ncbi:tRNA dimethylallyltransferase [hydrothermal vent metagenome]|uniref:tRNA dimethylallyltransferase n=1 Tax=hydrothermal vent metagenome TaxID=652676 RepID=A0A3B1D755_9ZZZZ
MFQGNTDNSWLILVGPTAVGKSAVAEILAQSFETDILIADSRQVYKNLEIGTGKPDFAARKRVKRHLIDFVSPEENFSAGAYKRKAEIHIAQMSAAGKKILIEGGTGLYLKALLYGLWDGPPADWVYREHLMAREKAEGPGTLHRDLSVLDPSSASKIHVRDVPRIVRALEVKYLTGRAISEIHAEDAAMRLKQTTPHSLIGLRRDRAYLYQRIEERVDAYMASGLLEEVERLLAAGLSGDFPAMRGLGYRQLIPHLKGLQSLDEAVSILKRDTRRFAKRQMTWFRADKNIHWIDIKVGESAIETADRIMRLKKEDSVL